MTNFLKRLFGRKAETPQAEKQRNDKRNFEIFKFDGLRAQRMGRMDYAVKCFEKALEIEREFETSGYLASLLIQLGQIEEARTLLEEMTVMEPGMTSTYLTLANVCFMQEDYAAMKENARKGIELEPENPLAYLLMAKAESGLNDNLNAIVHLTQAIGKKEDYTEAYLMRGEVLLQMQQYTEAMRDAETILARTPDDESALLLRGKIKEATGDGEGAHKDYVGITEINPFNEQAYLLLGRLLISRKAFDEAIAYLDEAIEINPGFAYAYRERGHAKLLKGDKDGSVEDMKKSLELNPDENISGQFSNFNDLYSNIPL